MKKACITILAFTVSFVTLNAQDSPEKKKATNSSALPTKSQWEKAKNKKPDQNGSVVETHEAARPKKGNLPGLPSDAQWKRAADLSRQSNAN